MAVAEKGTDRRERGDYSTREGGGPGRKSCGIPKLEPRGRNSSS